MNNCVLIGRLVKDPELKYLTSGTAISKFTIAADKGLSKQQKLECENNKKPTADFINIVVWGKTAELAANYLGKGLQVGIQGRIQTRSWDDEGQRKYATEIVADKIEFIGKKDENIAGFTETDEVLPWDK